MQASFTETQVRMYGAFCNGRPARKTQVAGQVFLVQSNDVYRGTLAFSVTTGEVKPISSSGYISNDLTVRKAIATAYGLNTFRK